VLHPTNLSALTPALSTRLSAALLASLGAQLPLLALGRGEQAGGTAATSGFRHEKKRVVLDVLHGCATARRPQHTSTVHGSTPSFSDRPGNNRGGQPGRPPP
jgi:hypothetical protein